MIIEPTPMDQENGRHRSRKIDLALLAILAIATVVVMSKDISVGGLRHGDSAAHAMDGVLIHDWIASGPDGWKNPMAFAEQQYAHYPTLGIGRHYPPGFAIAEAPFFAIMGVSVVAARTTVVFFAVMAAMGTFIYVRRFTSRRTALLSALALVILPTTTQWGRQVMLEVPTLAVLIGTAIAWVHYQREPTHRRLTLLLLVALLSLLFKQPAIFILAAITFSLGFCWLIGKVRLAHCIASAGVTAVAGVVVVLSLDGHGSLLLRGDATFASRWSLEALTFYATCIPNQVGMPILILMAMGIAFFRRLPNVQTVFLLSWFLACYAMLLIADYKNPRFLYLALFPIAVFAGHGASSLLERFKSKPLPIATASLACLVGLGSAYESPIKHRPDFSPVVLENRNQIIGRAILFSGLRDGDFVFAVRQHLPWRSTVVIRASKLLYTCNGRTDLEFESAVTDGTHVADLIRTYGFQSIFLEQPDKLNLREEAWLREYVNTSTDYQLTGTWLFNMEQHPDYRDSSLWAFQAVRPLSRVTKYFDIFIPRSQKTIRVDLSQWS